MEGGWGGLYFNLAIIASRVWLGGGRTHCHLWVTLALEEGGNSCTRSSKVGSGSQRFIRFKQRQLSTSAFISTASATESIEAKFISDTASRNSQYLIRFGKNMLSEILALPKAPYSRTSSLGSILKTSAMADGLMLEDWYTPKHFSLGQARDKMYKASGVNVRLHLTSNISKFVPVSCRAICNKTASVTARPTPQYDKLRYLKVFTFVTRLMRPICVMLEHAEISNSSTGTNFQSLITKQSSRTGV